MTTTFTPMTPVTLDAIDAPMLDATTRQVLLDAINGTRLGFFTFSVAVEYDKQTKAKPRVEGTHYMGLPGATSKLHVGTLVAAPTNKEGEVYLRVLDMARAELPHEWMLCFDPDERIAGDLRGFVSSLAHDECDAVRVQLFDAYMTQDDHTPYTKGDELLDFRRFYGPEQRNILMLWRNRPEIVFAEGDGRTPRGMAREKIGLYCQHYGKSLSVAHWEETCDYYIRHFPFETYGKKWTERKGQAIHTESDFKRPLYEWGEALFANAVPM